MLAKQWLQAYISNISGSPHHRARQRQSRYIQLQIWNVLPLINALPLLLHVALFLFFTGLIIFLRSVDLPISIATLIIVTLAYTFYCASIWLPLIYPDCPYQHPMSDHFRKWLKLASGSNQRESIELSLEDEEMVPNQVYVLLGHKFDALTTVLLGLLLQHKTTSLTHLLLFGFSPNLPTNV
jgi:hypothetical protein